MRKTYIILLLGLLWACSENERLLYDSGMHDIYYSLVNEDRDSTYASLLTADGEMTFKVGISLLGNVLPASGRFKVETVPELTTAEVGLHYRPLQEYYEFPADTFQYHIPVELLKGDERLTRESVVLALRLLPTADLGVAYDDRSVIRIVIADMLKKPEGEGYWGDMTAFRNLFGEYSRKKHTMIIELTGHDFWDGGYGDYGGAYGILYEKAYYTPYARKLYKIVTENEIRDENGKIIQGWMVP